MTARIYSEEPELYDIAFDWDLAAEADWLVDRLGPGCRSVLEPGCGTGRLLEALARRGLEAVGFDISQAMVAYARRRLERAGARADVVRADMADFDLGRRFDGAVSAISTASLLTGEGLATHLEAVARHLHPGSRYLVQLALAVAPTPPWRSEWEAERGDTKLRIVWEALDAQHSRSRFEIIAGPRAGEIVEDLHETTSWDPDAWRQTVAASPFAQVACYDGELAGRPPVEPERGGGYLWHELVAP